ncbi:hypothetical protein [Pontibacter beigongshangensis]|uniref:hypothetical protein n=1 Tax=Pontibacter beigongshangensis TaxID=2574733 RepID=UPI00164FAE8A|nr:hypothetical protein [Pontibacter beigongshangensis]
MEPLSIQLSQQTRVLLVSNHLTWNPITWLSFLIRVFTCSHVNHAAILHEGQVYEMVGKGLAVTPYEKWLTHTRREVVVMKPKVPVQLPVVACGYGFLDLVQILLHIIRKKWLLRGNSWNGVSGTRLWSGLICSEYVGLALGKEKPHLVMPCDLLFAPELEFEKEFSTAKG